jgi:hypothetical protein
MHGIIHLELQQFVANNYGAEAWKALLDRAGLAQQIYTPLQSYPDTEMLSLVAAATELTGLPANDLLEAFGAFLAPRYLAMYGRLLKPEWRTLDVIEHTEETIHRVVRLRQPGAAPPRLKAERVEPHQVVLVYDSPRKLCAVARGIAKGLAKHFDESIDIWERTCMHRGEPACTLIFRAANRAE